MRRDAEERRNALIRAAIQSFHEHGYQVPLDEIARRAGVGRGTLYRNFKDRLALILAIFHHDIDQAEQQIAGVSDVREALTLIMVRAAPLSALYSRLAFDLEDDEETRARFQEIAARTDAFLRPIVERAHDLGVLRRDVGLAELQMILRMGGGLVLPSHTKEEARQLAEQALALVMDGLRPR